ncbi:hypothetical protein KO500_07295 [Cellulophaga baltica]|uniref:tetratricopeptide repeat protein n=1 Tax=Cellulophaga TaxID=104264 RepID=UPI001C06D9D7|nr:MULTISPECIES: hypothetical protein [Cellulophaga]MBU2996233.1 hypothetical protein [Cellulophaga baltica]MDO6767628.1 hypothetical protein [Cellulophaga sp. 1_MG-2023]
MQLTNEKNKETTLREYTRLIIAFLFCLVVLSVFQYAMLYFKGVIDSIFNVSFVLSVVHHLGYSSFIGILLVSFFRLIEYFKPKKGFKFIYGCLLVLLSVESALMSYFILEYTPYEASIFNNNFVDSVFLVHNTPGFLFYWVIGLIALLFLFVYFYKLTVKFYHHISNMFPLTIVFLTVFIATLFTEGRPINENKTQYLVSTFVIEKNVDIKNGKKSQFTNEEIVWINSQFNGHDFDNAYKKARQFAFDKNYEKAQLLIRYILSEIPNHIDAKILEGRLYAWNGNYEKAIQVFEECLVLNTSYDDTYKALLDVCYWSDENEKVLYLFDEIEINTINSPELVEKIARAYHRVKENPENPKISNLKIEVFLASVE